MPDRAPINADALVLMAESLLANGEHGRAAAERAQVVVHVDADALAGAERGPRRCELEEGAPIAPETARRLSCDAARTTIAEGRDGPLDVGRRARTVPPAMRRALSARDGGCRFPGCTHRRWTDAHHIRHWSQGGETSAANLVSLCRRHHRLVHEGGFRVDRDPAGELRFRSPDGSELATSPALQAAPRSRHALRDTVRDRQGARRRAVGLDPAVGNPMPLSSGDRLDLDHAVMVLAARGSPSGRDSPRR